MTLSFVKASCVAVGTFNIYIIQPAWLTTVGILPRDTPIVIEANMSRPGFRLSSPSLKTVWIVQPGKLAIETSDPTEDCGRYVASVLERLPVTPIFALGNNAVFEADRAAVGSLPVLQSCAALAATPEGYADSRRTFASSFTREGRQFNLQVIMRPDAAVEFTGNANVALGDSGTAEKAVEFAKQFPADRDVLASLLSRVYGVGHDGGHT